MKMLLMYLIVFMQLVFADQIPIELITDKCPVGNPYNSQVDFPYRPFPYQQSLMEINSQTNYSSAISFIDMDIYTYNQTNMDNGGLFLLAVLLKDNFYGYQIGLKKTKDNAGASLTNYDRYFFETRIDLTKANIVPIQIEWSLNTDNKLFVLGYSTSNNKQLVLLELQLTYYQILKSNPAKNLFSISQQNSQNMAELTDSYQNLINGSLKINFACLNNIDSESFCFLVYQEDFSSLIQIVQVDRSLEKIQRSFALDELGLVFDKMQIVSDLSTSTALLQKINLVIIANQLQKNSQTSSGLQSCINPLYTTPCKNTPTILGTSQGPIIFSIAPMNSSSTFDTIDTSVNYILTIKGKCYDRTNCSTKTKYCQYAFKDNCITNLCCKTTTLSYCCGGDVNSSCPAVCKLTIEHDDFLIKKTILNYPSGDLADTLILRENNKKCPKGSGLSCLSFIVQISSSSMTNKPSAAYLAVQLKLQGFDSTNNLAAFSVSYASEITDTQGTKAEDITSVNITSPLFILGSSGSVGVILYPQYHSSGWYVISSAQIQSSSITFCQQTTSNNKFLQNLDFKAVSFIQQGTKIFPIGIAQDKSTKDSILSIFAPTTEQQYMSTFASSNYFNAYSRTSVQSKKPEFSGDKSSVYSKDIATYSHQLNIKFKFESVNNQSLDVIYPQYIYKDVFYVNTFETLCPYVWNSDSKMNTPLHFTKMVTNSRDEDKNSQSFKIYSSHFWYYSIQAQQVYDPLLSTIDFAQLTVSIDYKNDYNMLLSIRVSLCDFVIKEISEKINIAYAPTSIKQVENAYVYSEVWMSFHCAQSNLNTPYLKGYKDENIKSLPFVIQVSGQSNWIFNLPVATEDDFGQSCNFTVKFYDILGQDLTSMTLTSFALTPPTIFTYPSIEAFGSLQSIYTVCDFSIKIKRFESKCRDYSVKIVIVPKQYKPWFLTLKETKIDEFVNLTIQYNAKQKKKKQLFNLFDFDQKLKLVKFDKEGNIGLDFKHDIMFMNNRALTWFPTDLFNQESSWTAFSIQMVQLSDENYDFEYEDQNYIYLDTKQQLQLSNSNIQNNLKTQNQASDFTYNKIVGWNCTWLTTRSIFFKVDFLNKSAIDYKRHGIYIVINENYSDYFINRMNGLRIMPNQSVFIYPIPQQFVPAIPKQTIVQNKTSYSDYSTAVSIGFAAQIALSQNFQNMWSLVNVCQIISLLLIADIQNWPIKSKTIIGFLNQLSNFDLFGSLVDKILNILFPILPQSWKEPLSPKLNEIGYNSITFSSNLGSFGLILFFLTMICFVVLLFAWFITRIERFKDLIDIFKLKQNMIKLLVSMVFGSYLAILMSSYIQITDLSFETFAQSCNSIVAIIFLIIVVILPLILAWQSIEYHKKNSQKVKDKIRARQNQESTFIQLAIFANYQRNGIKKDEEEQSIKETKEQSDSKNIIQNGQNLGHINESDLITKKKQNNQNLQFEGGKKQNQIKTVKFEETTNQIPNQGNTNQKAIVNALLIGKEVNYFEEILKIQEAAKEEEIKQKNELKKEIQKEEILQKTEKNPENKVYQGIFDSIFDQYRPQTKITLLFDVFFALRRLMLASFIFYLRDSYFFLTPFLILIIFTSGSQMYYLIMHKPFVKKAQNNMEFVNELFLFLICHTFLIYSINGQLTQIKHDDVYFSQYLEDISFTQDKYDFEGFIQNLTQKLNFAEDKENVKTYKISKDQQLLTDIQKIQTDYLDNIIFILILVMVSINIIFMIFDSVNSFYRVIIRTLNRNFKLRRCIKRNVIYCCCPKLIQSQWDLYEKGRKDELDKIIDSMKKQEERIIAIKLRGPNAVNPVQQLIKKKVSRILNWQDLGLTQQDLDKLTDEQRKKLWELAIIKKRQLAAIDDDQNKELLLDDKILSKSTLQKDVNNQAFEQDEELEKKWKKVEGEIEKQKSLAQTLERVQGHYQNNLPNIILSNKEREQKVEKMKQDKEQFKKQRAQTLWLTQRQQFILQQKKQSDERQQAEEKNLFKLNQSLSNNSIEQTPRFNVSPRFQQETEQDHANDNIQIGKKVKKINKDIKKKQGK